MKFNRAALKAIAAFAATALPVAAITALIVAHTSSTDAATTAVIVESSTTTIPSDSATTTNPTQPPQPTTTTVALELSDATVAVQSETMGWQRTAITQCACSIEFPGPISQSSSALPDGRPAYLVLSQSVDSSVSAALWTTAATADADRDEELRTVLGAIANGAQLLDQVSNSERAQATMVDGSTRAKIDVRTSGEKIVVLFIASDNGIGLEEASARYSTSLRL